MREVAEALGAAVLTVSVDDTQLRAGFLAIQNEAQRTATLVQQAFAQASQQRMPTMPKPALPPAIPPEYFNQQAAGFTSVGEAARRSASGMSQFFQVLGAIGAGATLAAFFKQSVNAAVELETITRKLSNTLGPQGAGAALAFTRGLSNDLGLSFKTLAGSFGSFTAAASSANVPIETQKNLFAAVAKAGQALGLSNYEIQGSLLALQQVAAKGTVQMEELRGQLGERLPIALTATAKGLGITQKELIQLVESGKLTSDRFFPALTKGLNELTQSAGGVPTAAQNFQKLANAWDELQTSFGTNLLPGVTEAVKTLTGVLEGIKVGSDASSLGLGGMFGNLGLVPKQGAAAVGALRAVQKQYNLTDKEARALFYDSAKLSGMKLTSTGFLPDARALEQTLERLPEIAKEWRARNKDATAELNAANATAEELRRKQEAAVAAQQKGLDKNLANDLSDMRILGIRRQMQLSEAKLRLDDQAYAKLELQVGLEEKINAEKAAQLQLDRELAKPKGAGDGKNGTQSLSRINDLQNGLLVAQAEVKAAYAEAGNTLVRLSRQAAAETRQVLAVFQQRNDELLAANRQGRDAVTGLNSPIPVNSLETAAAEGQRQVAALVVGLQDGIADAARTAERAAQALADAQRRQAGGEPIPRAEMAKLLADTETTGKKLETAGLVAGRALLDNATQAEDRLQKAQQGFQDTLRGGFQYLTAAEQSKQLTEARREISKYGKGFIDLKFLQVGASPDQVLGAASFAKSINRAQTELSLAENLKTAADAAASNSTAIVGQATAMGRLSTALEGLGQKKWEVNVNVQPPSSRLP